MHCTFDQMCCMFDQIRCTFGQLHKPNPNPNSKTNPHLALTLTLTLLQVHCVKYCAIRQMLRNWWNDHRCSMFGLTCNWPNAHYITNTTSPMKHRIDRTGHLPVTGTYYHPGSKILPLWTVSRRDYPSVTTKLVPPLPHYDTHLGEMSIH